jgi:hypothetical protein
MDDNLYEAQKDIDASKHLSKSLLAEKAVDIAMKQIMAANEFKKPRIQRLNLYWELYDGKVKKKLRQLFNIPLPVFSGMVDTLCAMHDTPIQLKFQEGDPADYFKVQKIQGAWNMEVLDSNQNSKWDAKFRIGRKHKVINGRDIYRYTVTSDPEYSSSLDVVELDDFTFQPKGGLWLENHLFAGEQCIQKTEAELREGVRNGIYDKEQVKELINLSSRGDYLPDDNPDFGRKLERFRPLGLDPDSHSYVGSAVFTIANHILEIDGVRYYLSFHPWTKKWLRFEKWKDICSSELYPWISSASHEDSKNFLSKSYGDDLYPAADAIISMFNQEMTNREKRNFGARAYDREMFPDVKRLDESMHRPDALVPVDTKGGTRRISEGIYEFKVGELGGTINLIDWIKHGIGTDVGVSDINQGQALTASKKASVTFMEQKAISKRLSYTSQPFQELITELGKRYIYGLKDHMPSKMAIKLMGERGWDWDEITKIDLSTKKDVDILVISTDKQVSDSELRKEKRKEALMAIGADPLLAPLVNPKARAEELLRSVGGYDDVEIATLMDTETFGSKKSSSHAAMAIQQILEGKKPELWYGADTFFMQRIVDFAVDHRSTLKKKYLELINYAMAHEPIAVANIERMATQQRFAMNRKAIQNMMEGSPQGINTAGEQGSALPTQREGLPGGVSNAMDVAGAVM